MKIDYKKYFSSPHQLFAKKLVWGLIFLLLLFFLVFRPSTDPDLGWHLKTGKLILEKGVPRTDWYSYTMPDYPWISHEWLSDVITYQIFSIAGFLGLSAFFSFLLLITFLLVFFTLPRSFSTELRILLILIAILVSKPVIFSGARIQYITLFGVAFLVYFLLKWREGRFSSKKLFILPFIFLIWVNLHGGFIIGLVLLFLFILLEWIYAFLNRKGFRFFQGKAPVDFKNLKKITVFFLVSLLATLCNPYLYRIYIEIYETFRDKETFNHISEWFSPNFHSANFLYFLAYFLVGVVFLAVSKRKPEFTLGLLTLFFLVMSFRSVRHIPIFAILATSFVAPYIDPLFKVIKKRFKYASFIFFFGLIGFLFVIVPFRIFDTIETSYLKGMYSVEGGYPTLAVEYLKARPLAGNVFNRYGWGGYLLYEGVVDKVFIDGRMPHWEKDGRCVFCDYMLIINVRPGWKEKLEQYEVDWVIINRNSPLDGALRETSNWEFYAGDRYGVVYKREE